MSSILISIKELLGIPSDVSDFDSQLVTYINMVFMTLAQMGFGPTSPYQITNKFGSWDDFMSNDEGPRDLVLIYMHLKVRVLFDPPSSSFVLDSMNRAINEYEWRLSVYENLV